MNRSGQPHSLRVVYRSVARLLALLWCVAPVLSAVHSAQEIHRYCAEHGVLEELEASAAAREVGDASGPVVDGTGADAPAHDHCAFVGFFRHARLLGGPCLTAVALSGSIPSPPPALAQVTAPVELLRLAPKTSPPV